mmetsp:Transcript_536/g.973  ORF Transcript_536/g.973 Transcript_536/m.973 type:complete len:268 (-) Transcript_536:277-1080(-)
MAFSVLPVEILRLVGSVDGRRRGIRAEFGLFSTIGGAKFDNRRLCGAPVGEARECSFDGRRGMRADTAPWEDAVSFAATDAPDCDPDFVLDDILSFDGRRRGIFIAVGCCEEMLLLALDLSSSSLSRSRPRLKIWSHPSRQGHSFEQVVPKRRTPSCFLHMSTSLARICFGVSSGCSASSLLKNLRENLSTNPTDDLRLFFHVGSFRTLLEMTELTRLFVRYGRSRAQGQLSPQVCPNLSLWDSHMCFLAVFTLIPEPLNSMSRMSL